MIHNNDRQQREAEIIKEVTDNSFKQKQSPLESIFFVFFFYHIIL